MIQSIAGFFSLLAVLALITMAFLLFGLRTTSNAQSYDIHKGKYVEGQNYTLSTSFLGPRSYTYTTKQNSDGNFFMFDGTTMHIGFINPLRGVFTNTLKSFETHLQIVDNGNIYTSTLMCSPVGNIDPTQVMCTKA